MLTIVAAKEGAKAPSTYMVRVNEMSWLSRAKSS